MSGDEKNRGVVADHQHNQYGTFQGVANYPPPPQQPAIGFPQPVPPPGLHEVPPPPPHYYPQGYQTVPGYAIAEGRPVRERRLPCCGFGCGWFLFIIGFFTAAIPWYLGLFVLLCARIDHREKPGYIACTVAAILATIAIILGVTKGADECKYEVYIMLNYLPHLLCNVIPHKESVLRHRIRASSVVDVDNQPGAVSSTQKNGLDDHDFISKLPNPLLSEILSRLSADEVVRTSILSSRWKDSWRYVSRLDLDPKRMLNLDKQVITQQNLLNEYLGVNNDNSSMNRRQIKKAISLASLMIDKVLFSQKCNLKSCKISHFSDTTKSAQLEKWIEFLESEKGIQELALACDEFIFSEVYPTGRYLDNCKLSLKSGIFNCSTLHALELTHYKLENESPFHNCPNLRTLKLKWLSLSTETLDGILASCPFLEHLSLSCCIGLDQVRIYKNEIVKTVELESLNLVAIYLSSKSLGVLVIHSLKCSPKNLIINAPKLRVFQAYFDLNLLRPQPTQFLRAAGDQPPLKVTSILEHCSGLLRSPDENDKFSSFFEELWTLSLDLDLNNIRELLILSIILRLCNNLQKLEINVKSDNGAQTGWLPYPESTLWEVRELCDCITHTLKVVTIKGFEGREREVEFVRHLIKNACAMKRIDIWCNNSCSRKGAEATLGLLSLPRSSIDVSIVLKPGPGLRSAE
ncbi:hypothetical protein CCACVL1_16567, partial [Corchorus capsularis]